MSHELGRREFLQASVAGGAICLGLSQLAAAQAAGAAPALISPGCRGTKVKVARLYLVGTNKLWPTPTLDVNAERKRYETEFARMKDDFADIDFTVDEIIESAADVSKLGDRLKDVEGILVIHTSMGTTDSLKQILAAKKPTVLFALPYSGHEWTGLGALRRQPEGALLECMLTADMNELAAAVRPFRAIHHLREAKILNITARVNEAYNDSMKKKFGTETVIVDRDRVIKVYETIPEADAQAEAERWIKQAQKVVEPSKDEVVRSCRLALTFEKLMNEEKATVVTADCYGSMYHQLPAFPCVGFVRLNNMGLGGICESDLVSAMTHIILQGLSGRPAFISDPTMDTSTNSIILAHCLGSTKMDGPKGDAAPYRLRTIMERQEGCVPQVFMRKGQKVTQARLIGTDLMLYFTGDVTDAPDDERGCRTKITVKIDGDAEKLWENWSNGLHRSTVYGNLVKDLQRFCRFTGIRLVNEAEELPTA